VTVLVDEPVHRIAEGVASVPGRLGHSSVGLAPIAAAVEVPRPGDAGPLATFTPEDPIEPRTTVIPVAHGCDN